MSNTNKKLSPRSETRIDWTGHKTDADYFTNRLANAYMFNRWQSDMSFFLELDNTTIPAHSLIVAASSPVLERIIFETDSVVKPNCVIKIQKCHLAEFEILLRFIYNGKVDKLNIKTAAVLLPLAHYFDLHQLEISCSRTIPRELKIENVCETFELIYTVENEAVDICFAMIQTDTMVLLENGSLMRMEEKLLTSILNHDVLNIPCEKLVFDSMLKWADEECLKHNLLADAVNRREVIGQRLYLVRFGMMSSDEFTACLAKVGEHFFSVNEIGEIMACIVLGSTPSAPKHLLYKRRPQMLCLHRSYANNFLKESFEITVKADKTSANVSIIGFITFNHNVSIVQGHRSIEYSQIGKQVIFECPLPLEKDLTCKFTVTVPKNDLNLQQQSALELYANDSWGKHPNLSLEVHGRFIPFCGLIFNKY